MVSRAVLSIAVAGALAAIGAADMEADCKAITHPRDAFKFETEWLPSSQTCVFRCSAEQGNIGCAASPDGFESTFRKAGIADDRTSCKRTSTPSEEAPDVVTITCPEYKFVIDLHGTGKLGHMTLEIDMVADAAVNAVKDAINQGRSDVVV